MDRTLIANTMILDGSGAAPFPGDVLVDGDPLADIKRLQNQDALLAIMKDGRLHKAPATA
jgi:hypothetical protein